MQRRKQAFLLVLTESGAGDVTAAVNAIADITAVYRVRGPYGGLPPPKTAPKSASDLLWEVDLRPDHV